jgi:uncharacterized protein YggE
MKLVRGLVLVLAVSLAVAGASSAAAATAPARATITVSGTGIVNSVPNRADFTFGVSATAKTATAALAANSSQMNKLISALEKRGIASKDIQTAEISLSPNTSPSGNRILGYTASNSVTTHILKIADAGPIVDAAVGAGANQINGPSLTAADQQALYRQALKAAIANARVKAATIAAAAHVSLGAIRAIDESSGGSTVPLPFSAATKVAGAATPVQPGTIQTEADVTVTYSVG